ncbi:MAG: redoxin domain-containing protein [Candidatus Neomarinimicrobiota bacterium]|mgnify:FL=1|tara:strand:- start:421 stop:957 length:537 start_codon:yes stop_codon:yes gene_type:complete
MRLRPGDSIDELNLPSISGEKFDIKKIENKRALITFYRFASCPFCNLRINEIVNRYSELDSEFKMVAVFDSPLDNLIKQTKHHNAPFWILADEKYHYFEKFSVEKSFLKFLKGTIVRFHKLIIASLKGYVPLTFKGSVSTIPVDILIDENGKIDTIYYGRDTSDHLPFSKIKEFSNNK